MLYQIPSFLLDVIVGLLGGACLLRLYMQYHRVPFGNPLGRFIFAITDWIVLPLRRIVPSVKRWDLASLIAAWLLVLLKFLLLWLLIGNLGRIATLPLVSLVGLLQLAISGLTALLVVYAVLSWVPGASPMLLDLISRLADPLVRPFRRFIPLIGGVDLSAPCRHRGAAGNCDRVEQSAGVCLSTDFLSRSQQKTNKKGPGALHPGPFALACRVSCASFSSPRRLAGAAASRACWQSSCAVRAGR
ncbi:uncharacterized protein YggT (Ycf19 family) [Variovorax sp. W1I1]|nr:uncharacterized protein YggT (Ycf19 family) [Variovorax sp. W1I1]